MARYLYSELSKTIQARNNSNPEWKTKHTDTIQMLVDLMPSGSGIDSGTHLHLDESHPEKLVFHAEFHHMNENGFYDGWTRHNIVVTPSLSHQFNLRISGPNRNDIKDYLHEVMDIALRQDVTYYLFKEQFPEFKITSKWENEDGTPSQCYQASYVGEKRFWNNPSAAIEYAGQQMEAKFYAR